MAPSLGTKTTGTQSHLYQQWMKRAASKLLGGRTLLLCLDCSRDAEKWKQRQGTPAAFATPTYLKNRPAHAASGVHTLVLCSGGTMSQCLAILNPITVCTKTQIQRDRLDTVRLWKATPSYLSAAAWLVYRRRDSGSGLVLSTATLRPSFRARWHADTQFCQEPSVSWHKRVRQKSQHYITSKGRC